MLTTRYKSAWVRNLKRRKRRARMMVAMAQEAIDKARTEQAKPTPGTESEALRCPRCGKKLAEPNKSGIIAGSFKCRNCKKVTVV